MLLCSSFFWGWCSGDIKLDLVFSHFLASELSEAAGTGVSVIVGFFFFMFFVGLAMFLKFEKYCVFKWWWNHLLGTTLRKRAIIFSVEVGTILNFVVNFESNYTCNIASVIFCQTLMMSWNFYDTFVLFFIMTNCYCFFLVVELVSRWWYMYSLLYSWVVNVQLSQTYQYVETD